jgi:hypothetical protein
VISISSESSDSGLGSPLTPLPEEYKTEKEKVDVDVNVNNLVFTDGIEYPLGIPTVLWEDGTRTVLPWVEDPENPGKNLLQNVSLSFVFYSFVVF